MYIKCRRFLNIVIMFVMLFLITSTIFATLSTLFVDISSQRITLLSDTSTNIEWFKVNVKNINICAGMNFVVASVYVPPRGLKFYVPKDEMKRFMGYSIMCKPSLEIGDKNGDIIVPTGEITRIASNITVGTKVHIVSWPFSIFRQNGKVYLKASGDFDIQSLFDYISLYSHFKRLEYSKTRVLRYVAEAKSDAESAVLDLTPIPPIPRMNLPEKCYQYLYYTFDGSESVDNGYIANYTWSLNGKQVQGKKIFSFFNTPGPNGISLTTTDGVGLRSTVNATVNVLPISALTSISKEHKLIFAQLGEKLTLRSPYPSRDNTWFGMGREFNGSDFSITPTFIGKSSVRLLSTHASSISEIDYSIVVDDTIPPHLHISMPSKITDTTTSVKITVEATDSSLPLETKIFVDGKEFDLKSIVYKFSKPGKHIILARVKDGRGNCRSCEKEIEVIDTIPPVIPEIGEINVPQDMSFTLNASGSSDNGRIIDYIWSIDDKMWRGERVETAIATPGKYVGKLILIDAYGNSSVKVFSVNVKDTMPPEVVVPATVTAVIGEKVNIRIEKISDPNGYNTPIWKFANLIELGDTFTYTFDRAGTYKVILITSDKLHNQGMKVITVEVIR